MSLRLSGRRLSRPTAGNAVAQACQRRSSATRPDAITFMPCIARMARHFMAECRSTQRGPFVMLEPLTAPLAHHPPFVHIREMEKRGVPISKRKLYDGLTGPFALDVEKR